MNQLCHYSREESTPVAFLSIVDFYEKITYNVISHSFQMKSIQLAPRLRYLQLNDDNGQFGLLIVHDGSHINYTIQVESYDELRAAIESFQEIPVGAPIA